MRKIQNKSPKRVKRKSVKKKVVSLKKPIKGKINSKIKSIRKKGVVSVKKPIKGKIKSQKKKSKIKSVRKKKKSVNKRISKNEHCKRNKISIVMREFKDKKLKTNAGYIVINPKQAIAIALSEAKRFC